MRSVLQVILFVMSIIALGYGKQTNVIFRKLSGSGGTVQCAVMAISNSFNGVRIQDRSNQCEPLPSAWNDSLGLSTSYTYYEKKDTVVIFQDDWMANFVEKMKIYYDFDLYATDGFYWTLPGRFEIGTRMEIHFQIPTDSYWDLTYCFGDESGERCHVYMYLEVNRDLEVRTYEFYQLSSGQREDFNVDFLTGVTYIASVEALDTEYNIRLTDGEVTHGGLFEYHHDAPRSDISALYISSAYYHNLKKISFINI